MGRIVVAPQVPDGLALFYTTSDSSGALDPPSIALVRNILEERFNIDAQLASCTQVHGINVVNAKGSDDWCEHPGCDALFTDQPHMALGIKVADCLPVTLIDPLHSVMANIHSGWRGAAGRIVPSALSKLATETAFDANRSIAWLGPSIRSCCFEVGEEVVSNFDQALGDVESFVDRTRGERPYLDLPALTRSLLTQGGVEARSIHDSGLCTRCDGSIFHSFRRNGPSAGRNLAIVAR